MKKMKPRLQSFKLRWKYYSRASVFSNVELKYNCTTNSFSQSRILFKDTPQYTIMENNKDELLIQGIEKYYNTSRENLVFHKKSNGRFRVTQILNSCDKETQCE